MSGGERRFPAHHDSKSADGGSSSMSSRSPYQHKESDSECLLSSSELSSLQVGCGRDESTGGPEAPERQAKAVPNNNTTIASTTNTIGTNTDPQAISLMATTTKSEKTLPIIILSDSILAERRMVDLANHFNFVILLRSQTHSSSIYKESLPLLRQNTQPITVWATWGSKMTDPSANGKTRRARAVKELWRTQQAKKAPLILETESRWWPKCLDDLTENQTQLFTCSFGRNHCIRIQLATLPPLPHMLCVCGNNGREAREVSIQDQHQSMETAEMFILSQMVSKIGTPSMQRLVGEVSGVSFGTEADESSELTSLQPNSVAESSELTSLQPEAIGTETNAETYPTEQAIRQKVARQKVKEELAEKGLTKEEIKKATKRKPQQQEDHHDDCGSDTGPIEDAKERALLTSTFDIDDAVAYSYFDNISDGEEEDNWEDMVRDSEFCFAYLLGSEVDEDSEEFLRRPPNATHVDSENLLNYLAQDGQKSTVNFVAHFSPKGFGPQSDQNGGPDGAIHLLEVFGGEGGATKIAIRRKFRTGQVFDLVCGMDLTTERDQRTLKEYVHRYKPLMIAAGPPCTAFANLSRINRKRYPEQWRRSREIGEKLARLTAELCWIQIRNGRYFLVENPASSDLFTLPEFEQLSHAPGVNGVIFPQCALGLQTPEGMPVRKSTCILTNSKEVLHQFDDLECTHEEHGAIVGSYQGQKRSALAQVWPTEMCRRIVEGIAQIIRRIRKDGELAYVAESSELSSLQPDAADACFPTQGGGKGRSKGKPRLYPEGVVFDCPACICRKAWTDRAHTRNSEPPLLCRYYNKVPEYQCEGCIAGRAADHPSHTHVIGDCRCPDARATGRRRRAGPVRDPAVPAAGSSADRNPVNQEHDLDAEVGEPGTADSSEPSGLQPEAGPSEPTEAEGHDAQSPREEIEAAEGDLLDEVVPATARELRIATAARRRKVAQTDSANQADDAAAEDWRAFDVSKALQALRSSDAQVRRKAIKRLHIRWWHAGVSDLQRILRAAGAPPAAIADTPAVVQGCLICRDWKKPPPHSVATFRIVLEFNEEVQWDLLFYMSLIEPTEHQRPISHLVDACIRWSSTALPRSREEADLCSAIAAQWIRIHGPMKTLVIDGETGLTGRCASDWAQAHGLNLKIKAPRQKAWIVERHQEILRVGLHRTETQLIKEQVVCTFEQVLAICTFAKNALTTINGSTPYQALYGRQPCMLPPLEGGHLGEVASLARKETNARSEARVREIAAMNIIESTAQARLSRAFRTHTRGAIELNEYHPQEKVDIWFEPTQKDQSGWRGPAEVLSANSREGNYSVRLQGRTLIRTPQEVRPHIAFFIYMMTFFEAVSADLEFILDVVENLKSNSTTIYGVILSNKDGIQGWHLTNSSRTSAGRNILRAALSVAHQSMYVQTCTTVRMWRGMHTVNPLIGFTYSEVAVWLPDASVSREMRAELLTQFSPQPGDLEKPIPSKLLAQEAVKDGKRNWQEVCFIQFLGVTNEEVNKIVTTIPEIPTLGGAGYHRSQQITPTTQLTPTTPQLKVTPGIPPPPKPSAPPPSITVSGPKSGMSQPGRLLDGPQPLHPEGGSSELSSLQPTPNGKSWTSGPKAVPVPIGSVRPSVISELSSLQTKSGAWYPKGASDNPTRGTTRAAEDNGPPRHPKRRSDHPSPMQQVSHSSNNPPPPPPPPKLSAHPAAQEQPALRPQQTDLDIDDLGDVIVTPTQPTTVTPLSRSRSSYGAATPQTIQCSIREHILRVIEEPFSRSRSPPERGGQAGPGPLLPLANQAATPQPATAASSGGHAAVSPAATIHYPSPSGSIATTIHYPSPESLASTLPYSPPTEAAVGQAGTAESSELTSLQPDAEPVRPAAAAAVKRGPQDSPEEQSEKKAARSSDSPLSHPGASSSSASQPLLPLKEEEEEEDEVALVQWLEQIQYGITDDLEKDFADFRGEFPELFEKGSAAADQLQEAVFNVLEEIKATGLPANEPSISVEGCMARCHDETGGILIDGDILAFEVSYDRFDSPQIVREQRPLTKEELSKHAFEVGVGKFKEISGLHALGCFQRYPRKSSRNRVDTRWVITWKLKDGKLIIKCRLTMRGFKDRQDELETFAGTASRSGQRVVNAITAQNPDFVLFSLDVSQAFAKGLTFEEYARATGTQLRAVEFELAPADIWILKKLPGFEDFDPIVEVLRMLKPIYGLKDAPRAWRMRLHQVLIAYGMHQLQAEAELYVLHDKPGKRLKALTGTETMPTDGESSELTSLQPDLSDKARADGPEKPESGKERLTRMLSKEKAAAEERQEVIRWRDTRIKQLRLILSAHVDDLKGGARKAVAQDLLQYLEKHFGTCKAEFKCFIHTGVYHEMHADGIFCHQWKYIEELVPLQLGDIRGRDEFELADEDHKSKFDSLLGGAAWTVLTRGDTAIYIQALQRRSAATRIIDLRRLNLVVRYLKRHKIGVKYLYLQGPVRLIGFTDSAFKAQEGESSGLAIRGLAVLLASDKLGDGHEKVAFQPGRAETVHLLDWIVRRLRRVVRSTFAAELNALIDSIETLILLQLTLHQIYCGTDESVEELLARLEAGQLYPPVDVVVDAKSVSDAISASDVCTPQESSLRIHLIAIRDRLSRGLLRSLSWGDTRDMVADALTKGGVDRTVIRKAMQGNLVMQHPCVTHWGQQPSKRQPRDF